MNWFLQDALVTTLALGALMILVRRVAGAVAPVRGQESCEKCPSCPGAPQSSRREPLIQIVSVPRR